MFQDEARFGRISKLMDCWAPRGIRPEVPCQIVREYTYAYAALSPQDGTMDSLIIDGVCGEAMQYFLEEVSRRHPQEEIIMVTDGASWHHSEALELPENITLLFLPPYSPQLNPVEVLWKEIRKEGFYNCVFDSMKAVEDQLEKVLRDFESDPDRVQSFSGFDWIVSIPLVAT